MKNLMGLVGLALVGAMMAGCATTSPEERRAAYQKEYDRLAALPPAVPVASPNPEVAGCARFASDLLNEVQPMMKAYVTSVENCREYTGFMNDIQYVKENENLSNEDATKKVAAEVMAADAKLPADQQVWPKIAKGIAAARALDPKAQLVKIGVLTVRNLDIVKNVQNLPNSFQNESMIGKAQRASECAEISKQLATVTECLVYLGDQFARVIELESYAR